MNNSTSPRVSESEADAASIVASRLARITKGILVLAVAVILLVLAVNFAQEGRLSPTMLVVASALPILVVMLHLAGRGYSKAATWVLVGIFYLVIVGVVITRGTIRVPGPSLLILITAMSGLVLGRRSMFIALAGGVLLLGGLAVAEANGLLPAPGTASILSYWLTYSIFAGAAGAILSFGRGMAEDALVRASSEIAERREVERSLRESEARFRSLTAMSSDFYWESDAEHRLTTRTESKREVDEEVFRQSSLVGLRRWEIPYLLPDEKSWREYRATLDAHLPFRNFEIARPRANGAVHHVSISGDPVFDATGEFKGYRGVGTDITERKQAEETLARLSHRNEIFLRNASDGIHILDVDGNVIEVSESFCEMLGYAREELIGANVSLWDAQWSPVELKQILAEHAQTQGRIKFETKHRRRDGSIVEVEITGQRLELDGKLALFNSSRDITERNRAAAALRESEIRLSAVFHASPIGISVSRISDGRILDANDAALQIHGYTRAEAIGRTVSELGVYAVPAQQEEMMQQIRKHGSVDRFPIEFRARGGEIGVLEMSSRIVELQGEPCRMTMMVDVTERKRLEEVRQQGQKLEALGTLAGGIAHDFNNIVARILGNTELAKQDSVANPAALKSLEEIRKAGSRAREVVQQILSFSRKQPTDFKLLALTPVVDESLRLLRTTLPARFLIESHCEPNLPLVRANATQIEQVLINLATNAMQAMAERPGQIDIRLDTVILDAALADTHPSLLVMRNQHPGLTVRLAVSDNGPGMDAETIRRIFEPFFTTRSADGGTGLGLSVVHGIIKAHDGAIEVESQVGNGTRFTIYLPAMNEQIAALVPHAGEETASPTLARARGQHVLYLDDDEDIVLLVQRLLERRGLRVSGYLRQDEALAALRAEPKAFDLVVTDYNMPGMSGLDVAREVHHIRKNLPVAIASGFIDENLRERAIEAGVRDLIFKANVVEDLCDAVQRLLTAHH